VHVIGLKSPETGLDGGEDVSTRQAGVVGSGAHLHSALCREDKLIALSAEPAAYDFFGAAGCFERNGYGVDVGCVNKVNPGAGRFIHDAKRGRLIALAAERHGAETDFGDLQPSTAKSFDFHLRTSRDSRQYAVGNRQLGRKRKSEGRKRPTM